jgi:hypothetical protein
MYSLGGGVTAGDGGGLSLSNQNSKFTIHNSKFLQPLLKKAKIWYNISI